MFLGEINRKSLPVYEPFND